MAFDVKNLAIIGGGAHGMMLLSYRTPDAWADVIDDGYFDRAYDALHEGDMLLVNAGHGMANAENGILAVARVVGRAVYVERMFARADAFGVL